MCVLLITSTSKLPKRHQRDRVCFVDRRSRSPRNSVSGRQLTCSARDIRAASLCACDGSDAADCSDSGCPGGAGDSLPKVLRISVDS